MGDPPLLLHPSPTREYTHITRSMYGLISSFSTTQSMRNFCGPIEDHVEDREVRRKGCYITI